jgi:hypothetical protein
MMNRMLSKVFTIIILLVLSTIKAAAAAAAATNTSSLISTSSETIHGRISRERRFVIYNSRRLTGECRKLKKSVLSYLARQSINASHQHLILFSRISHIIDFLSLF